MAWKQMDIGQQRAEFAVRLARGEKLSSLCREYEITRPTGYLWKRRFAEHGVAGLEDRSRRPEHSPHRVLAPIEARRGRGADRAAAHGQTGSGRTQTGLVAGQRGLLYSRHNRTSCVAAT